MKADECVVCLRNAVCSLIDVRGCVGGGEGWCETCYRNRKRVPCRVLLPVAEQRSLAGRNAQGL